MHASSTWSGVVRLWGLYAPGVHLPAKVTNDYFQGGPIVIVAIDCVELNNDKLVARSSITVAYYVGESFLDG